MTPFLQSAHQVTASLRLLCCCCLTEGAAAMVDVRCCCAQLMMMILIYKKQLSCQSVVTATAPSSTLEGQQLLLSAYWQCPHFLPTGRPPICICTHSWPG